MGRRPAPLLFGSMFAAQAGILVLTPILPELSREFGISTATAGELRLLSAIAGGITALALAPLARRIDLRGLLIVGLTLLGAGAVGSSIAPGLVELGAAQFAIGAGGAVVASAAIAAAAEWAGPRQRVSLVSWALVGQPAAWVAGMPVAGAVAEIDWRLAWIAVPFAASVVTIAAARWRAPRGLPLAASHAHRLWRVPAIAGWATGELLAYAGWGGTLVYAGALFRESYGMSAGTVGLLLGAGAAAYFPGSFLARRFADRAPRRVLIALGLALAAGVAAFGTIRPGVPFTAAAFTVLVFLAAGRALAGSVMGLHVAPRDKVAVTSIRAAATQFGYLLGVAAGGAGLAVGGYPALGLVLGGLFAAAVLPHIAVAVASRSSASACGAAAAELARA
jgi:predicted MFS family arabinose efflux permease